MPMPANYPFLRPFAQAQSQAPVMAPAGTMAAQLAPVALTQAVAMPTQAAPAPVVKAAVSPLQVVPATVVSTSPPAASDFSTDPEQPSSSPSVNDDYHADPHVQAPHWRMPPSPHRYVKLSQRLGYSPNMSYSEHPRHIQYDWMAESEVVINLEPEEPFSQFEEELRMMGYEEDVDMA